MSPQGNRNHYKQDRMYELASRYRLPVILFGEGGGGRPGDDNDGPRVFSLITDCGDGTNLKSGCEMGLKIIKRGVDEQKKTIVGYRFKPLA